MASRVGRKTTVTPPLAGAAAKPGSGGAGAGFAFNFQGFEGADTDDDAPAMQGKPPLRFKVRSHSLAL